jgi:hypothetical protein
VISIIADTKLNNILQKGQTTSDIELARINSNTINIDLKDLFKVINK